MTPAATPEPPTSIHPVSSWLAWVVLLNAVWLTVLRLFPNIGPAVTEETLFFTGLIQRFIANPYYGFMGASFIGSMVFGLCLWTVVSGRTWKVAAVAIGAKGDTELNQPDQYKIMRAPLRDAAALFPGLGFLGTVIGVSFAIGGLQLVIDGGDPSELIDGLRTAFDTTFIGLVASLTLTILLMLCDQSAARKSAQDN